MTEQMNQPKDKLVADIKLVIADAEKLLAEAASQTGECITDLRERMQDNLRNARHRLCELEDVMVVNTREAVKATDHYVHENPWRAVGVAAGVGLVIGLLICRR